MFCETKSSWLSKHAARLAIASMEYLRISSSTLPERANVDKGSSTPITINARRCCSWVHKLPIPNAPTRWQSVSCDSRKDVNNSWPPLSIIVSAPKTFPAKFANNRPLSRWISIRRERMALMHGTTTPSLAMTSWLSDISDKFAKHSHA